MKKMKRNPESPRSSVAIACDIISFRDMFVRKFNIRPLSLMVKKGAENKSIKDNWLMILSEIY